MNSYQGCLLIKHVLFFFVFVLMNFIFENIDLLRYKYVRSEMIALYLRAFTTGEHAQYISRTDAALTLDELMSCGNALCVRWEERLIGYVLTVPLSQDKYFPFFRHPEIEPDSVSYIAELLVSDEFQSQGVASQLMKQLIENVDKNKTDTLVIRVWDENQKALNLYLKFGFLVFDSIIQQKKHSRTEYFEMKKLYLYRTLID